jgi:hypothetical protein
MEINGCKGLSKKLARAEANQGVFLRKSEPWR